MFSVFFMYNYFLQAVVKNQLLDRLLGYYYFWLNVLTKIVYLISNLTDSIWDSDSSENVHINI